MSDAIKNQDAVLAEIRGLAVIEAYKLIKAAGMKMRVVRYEDESVVGMRDHRTDRVNVRIKGGVVISGAIG